MEEKNSCLALRKIASIITTKVLLKSCCLYYIYVHSDIVCSYCVIETPKFSRLFDHYKLCSLVFRYRCLLKFVELQVTDNNKRTQLLQS